MSLSRNIKHLDVSLPSLAFRPSQTYLSATGAYTLFTITGGAIEILSLCARNTAAPVGAALVRCSVNGINLDSGTVDIGTAGVVGGIFWSALNVGGIGTSAAAAPRTVATATTFLAGPGGTGVICTFSAGTSLTLEWGMTYRKLNASATVYAT
jgi:hypothetical protein